MTATPTRTYPSRLERLPDLACDLWWTWNRAREVFRRLDYSLWHSSDHNPVMMLNRITPGVLERVIKDPELLSLYDQAVADMDRTRSATDTWWQTHVSADPQVTIAYFSAEFALHRSLPIYAGGLGVLAGDHCKEASDLGVPLVGIGFMYPQGYFRQRLSPEGWQHEVYERLDWNSAPVQKARSVDGKLNIVEVPLGTRTVFVQVWEVRLGRVRLLLLDTDLDQNAPWDRELSARLYGGGQDTRLQQEIVLGLGGVLALRNAGIAPHAWHLNEGHAAFVVLQRMRDFLAAGLAWEDALEEVRRSTIFTTHTPVPAGHDAFPFHMIEQQLAGCWGSMNGKSQQFLALGHYDAGMGPQFNMTALAMRSARAINAVSQLHGQVTRDMFAPLWPDKPSDERPVGAITNGVHAPTWLCRELGRLFDAKLGPDWRERYADPGYWQGILEIPDEELWAVRMSVRRDLFEFVRERTRQRWVEDNATAARVMAAGVMLDPRVLTIGFARRFTRYKRSSLLFSDPDRLARIIMSADRPVQFIFAGKAHPADEAGKHDLQTIIRHALEPRMGGRLAFIDDYDLHVGRRLVQGCDVWLNTPRKPLEASGTSGMKAGMNGVLHLSIGDGWWAEGYDGTNGWQIVGHTSSTNPDEVDAADAEALYTLLEREVVPTFYDRDASGLSRRWLAMIKRSIFTVTPRFSARRMLQDYVRLAYAPAITREGLSVGSRGTE